MNPFPCASDEATPVYQTASSSIVVLPSYQNAAPTRMTSAANVISASPRNVCSEMDDGSARASVVVVTRAG